jgi:hypothetical protein
VPRNAALKVCEFHGVDFAELFPDAVLAVTRNRIAVKVDAPELLPLSAAAHLALPGPGVDEQAERALLSEQIGRVLNTLNEREAGVLCMRYGLDGVGELALEDVGKIMGVTGQRIRQIEAKALRKLRHPSRSRKLKEFYGEGAKAPAPYRPPPCPLLTPRAREVLQTMVDRAGTDAGDLVREQRQGVQEFWCVGPVRTTFQVVDALDRLGLIRNICDPYGSVLRCRVFVKKARRELAHPTYEPAM